MMPDQGPITANQGKVGAVMGENPVEMVNALLSPLHIGVQEDFGIRVGAKGVPPAFQLAAQFTKVIEFSIICQRVGVIPGLVDHRLGAALWVNHDQATVCQRCPWGKPASLRIRPSMAECLGHSFYRCPLKGEIGFPIDPSCNSTHQFFLSSRFHPEQLLAAERGVARAAPSPGFIETISARQQRFILTLQ